jgi:anti-sigma factor RsiW
VNREDLIDYVDGGLAEQKLREVEHHLEGCGTCRAYVGSLKRTLAAASRHRVAEPFEAYWAHFEEVVRERSAGRAPRSWLRSWRLAPALAVLAVAVGLAVNYLAGPAGERAAAPTPASWAGSRGAGSAGVDSLVVASLAQVPDEAMASLQDYLAGDDIDPDLADLAGDLPRSARRALADRFIELMKLKG